MKKRKKRSYSPIFMLIILTLVIMVASLIFDFLGIEGQKATIVNGTLETTLTTVKNIFSVAGLQYLFTHITSNSAVLEPLVLLIISLMGISVGMTSGLFKIIFRPLRKCNLSVITFITLLISIMSSFFGESAYVILIPFVAVMYQYSGRNPMVGAMTAFLGITVGYGTNVMFTNDDFILGKLTEVAATAEVDKNYAFHLMANQFIMIASTILLTVIGTTIISRFLANQYPKKYKVDEEIVISKKGMIATVITFIILIGIVIYMIVPGLKLPGTGALLDFEGEVYVNQLLGKNSPFRNGIVLILTMIVSICSFVYGRVSGTMKDNHEYGIGLSKNFKDFGYLFVLLFFVSLLTTVLDYTNLGVVIATKLIDFTSTIPMSGIPLIVVAFFIMILMSILIPDANAKWSIASPIIIPLFMRANMTPDFTQFLFKAADGIGKCFSPIFIYFIILIGFLQKYNQGEEEITVFGAMKSMLPTIILFTIVWLLIMTGWYVVGLPLGIDTYPTL